MCIHTLITPNDKVHDYVIMIHAKVEVRHFIKKGRDKNHKIGAQKKKRIIRLLIFILTRKKIIDINSLLSFCPL